MLSAWDCFDVCTYIYICSLNLEFFIYSWMLYEITRRDPSHSSQDTVKGWVDRLNESLTCGLRFSQDLATTLIQRANNLRYRLKNKGGWRRDNILSQSWNLVIRGGGDATSTHTPSDDVAKFSQQVKALQS